MTVFAKLQDSCCPDTEKRQSAFCAAEKLLWIQAWMQHSRWGLTRAEQKAQSPPSTCWPPLCWCSSAHSWPSGLKAHTAGSCQTSCPPEPSSLSPQGWYQWVLPVCPTPTQMQHLALRLVESQVHVGPRLRKLVHVPLDGISFFCCINCSIQNCL